MAIRLNCHLNLWHKYGNALSVCVCLGFFSPIIQRKLHWPTIHMGDLVQYLWKKKLANKDRCRKIKSKTNIAFHVQCTVFLFLSSASENQLSTKSVQIYTLYNKITLWLYIENVHRSTDHIKWVYWFLVFVCEFCEADWHLLQSYRNCLNRLALTFDTFGKVVLHTCTINEKKNTLCP